MKPVAKLSTPIPTLEEYGDSLGISRTRQASLIRLAKSEKTGSRAAGKKKTEGTKAAVAKR